ncbi:TPP1 [Scenedesmus sp. PABB004]|nr:TPP1 [Scenedesmus sp. PABB004]
MVTDGQLAPGLGGPLAKSASGVAGADAAGRACGAGAPLSGPGGLEDECDAEYVAWRAAHPCILKHFDAFLERVNGKRVAVFLDYDGTLTPIVNNPEQAILSPQMRDTVRQVAHLFPTAIISGRGRDKVEGFVQLPELFYAGSHGMDIAGPRDDHSNLTPHNFQAAAEFRPMIDQLYHDLCQRLQDIPGASVEHNNFCVSAHFRNCATENWQQVVAAVNASVAAAPAHLHVTRGRKVLEVRPQVDWDKGRALLHLLEVLGLQAQADVLPIYIGDDKTDEDAFAALSGGGVGILVSTKAKPTAAAFTVRDPDEVAAFLGMLVRYGTSCANGWWSHQHACNGWAPAHLRHSSSAPAGLAALGTAAARAPPRTLRVKTAGTEQALEIAVDAAASLADVARQVRAAKGWPEAQHLRFICGGQELLLSDPVSRAGDVLHCIPTDAAPRRPAAAHKPEAAAVDWLELLDPGIVLMWLFGCILAMLWLLFACHASMFDRTSLAMLVLMTGAFMVPCALAHPCLRRLSAAPLAGGALHGVHGAGQLRTPGALDGLAAAAAPPPPQPPAPAWQGYHGGAIPPRPAARVRGPGRGGAPAPPPPAR